MLAAPLQQLVGGSLLPRLEFDESARRLAPFVVGFCHHRGGGDCGMLVKRVLHLDRGDILAAGNDDVLRAIFQLDVAIRMHDAEIAGVEPAAGKLLLGRSLVLEIALHHDIAAHHHLAQCLAVAAVVAKPDDKWGETPCAFVELKPGQKATADELLQWCRQHLAGYKCPRTVVFADIPKTSTGKIQKFKLREMAKAV